MLVSETSGPVSSRTRRRVGGDREASTGNDRRGDDNTGPDGQRRRDRFGQVTATGNVACGSEIVTVNSPTLQCDT